MIGDYTRKVVEDSATWNLGTNTCIACYNAVFFGTTYAPSSGEITECAGTMQDANAAYNRIRGEIGPLNEEAANTCAVKRGGYYSRATDGPLRMEDRPNLTPPSRVCPYPP
jgi:hypothetical protein